jgi:hypothetical protein
MRVTLNKAVLPFVALLGLMACLMVAQVNPFFDPVAISQPPMAAPGGGGGAPGFAAGTNGFVPFSSPSTTITMSNLVVSGSNKILVCGFTVGGGLVTQITWNGSTNGWQLLFRTNWFNSSTTGSELWYLIAPGNATANVVVTADTSTDLGGCVLLFTNVHQTVPFGTVSARFYDGTSMTGTTNTVTSGTNDLVVDVLTKDVGAAAVGSLQTKRQDNADNGSANSAMSTASGQATTTTMSWTNASSHLSWIGVALKAP